MEICLTEHGIMVSRQNTLNMPPTNTHDTVALMKKTYHPQILSNILTPSEITSE